MGVNGSFDCAQDRHRAFTAQLAVATQTPLANLRREIGVLEIGTPNKPRIEHDLGENDKGEGWGKGGMDCAKGGKRKASRRASEEDTARGGGRCLGEGCQGQLKASPFHSIEHTNLLQALDFLEIRILLASGEEAPYESRYNTRTNHTAHEGQYLEALNPRQGCLVRGFLDARMKSVSTP